MSNWCPSKRMSFSPEITQAGTERQKKWMDGFVNLKNQPMPAGGVLGRADHEERGKFDKRRGEMRNRKSYGCIFSNIYLVNYILYIRIYNYNNYFKIIYSKYNNNNKYIIIYENNMY